MVKLEKCRLERFGNTKLSEEKYKEAQDAMIDAMIRLEKSSRPHIAKLKI